MDSPDPQIIHLEKSKQSSSLHVLLLFIPAVIFILFIALLAKAQPSQYAVSTTDSYVLGEENEK